MSEVSYDLLAVYVDGETKTGKGAAGKAIAEALQQAGWHVYYDVAGDFYRRYVAMVRLELGLADSQPLPTGEPLEKIARELYTSGRAFELDENLGDLQRPAISQSVSVFGELALAQQAGRDWWAMSARQAQADGAEVVVLDGRNPRSRMQAQAMYTGILPRTALDLYMTCKAAEAAKRVLLGRGITMPTAEELATEETVVRKRRDQDRNRAEQPFIVPTISEIFLSDEMSVGMILGRARQPHGDAVLPVTITLDNTQLAEPDMLHIVTELALAAVKEASSLPPS